MSMRECEEFQSVYAPECEMSTNYCTLPHLITALNFASFPIVCGWI